MKHLVAVAVIGLSPLLAAPACNPTSQGQVVQTVPPAVALVECIYQQIDSCIANHVTWPVCTAQSASACGTDVATIVSIWASKRAAEAREVDASALVGYP